MRGLGSKLRIAAVATVALLAAGCGGDDSSGLATLVGTATSAPTTDPAGIEPVSEPTAATQTTSESAETIEPVSSETEDPADAEADEAPGAAAVAEPEDTTGGEPAGPEDTSVAESTEPEDTTGGESAEPENTSIGESVEREDLTDEERLLAFAECMRENGVDFPDPVVEADGAVTFGFRPGSGGGGLQALREIGRDPDLPAARETCQGLVAGVAFGAGPGGFDQIELQDTLLEFARCMRDHGVDIGDPDMSRIGPGANDDDQAGGPFGAIDTDDPDFAPAFEVCQQQLPGAGQGARFGGGG
ncbi:MAG: hypothetical protein OXC00_13410 [Acidimicrobiaceae bacterium]|nr:hypothetical protein [Acidimicrobiaceae bacterium]